MKTLGRLASLVILSALISISAPAQQQKLIARVAAGRTTPYTDSKGQVWQPDTGLFNVGTASTVCPTQTASGAETGLYKSARYGATNNPEMAYTFSNLANGTYTVNLYLDECLRTGANQRIFSVQANGITVLPSIDVFALAGGRNIPTQKSFTAVVSGGKLLVQFSHVSGDNPSFNGIEVFLAVADTTPPVVSIAVPSSAMNLSSPTPIIINASDETALQGVTAILDGQNSPLTASPLGYTGADLAALKAGPHTLIASATDTSGNTATANTNFVIAIAVSVSITATPKPHSVAITWGASSTANVSYNVYRRLSGGVFGAALSNTKTLAFTDSAVTLGANYSYAVTAVASDGQESAKSAEVSATIPAQ